MHMAIRSLKFFFLQFFNVLFYFFIFFLFIFFNFFYSFSMSSSLSYLENTKFYDKKKEVWG